MQAAWASLLPVLRWVPGPVRCVLCRKEWVCHGLLAGQPLLHTQPPRSEHCSRTARGRSATQIIVCRSLPVQAKSNKIQAGRTSVAC